MTQDSQGSSPPRSAFAPATLVLSVIGGLTVLSVGGWLCGLALSRLGTLGALSLWLLGWTAGAVASKLMREKSKVVGVILFAACLIAFVVAEACWLHWNTRNGEESWGAAVRLLPLFFREYTLAAAIGLLCSVLGGLAAYRQTAVRYRVVLVRED